VSVPNCAQRDRWGAGDGDTMEQIAIRLPKALLEKLDDDVAGRLDGKNRSDLIRESIVEA